MIDQLAHLSPLIAATAASETGSVNTLVDIVIVLAGCVLFGLVARALGQSLLVGYLLAGIVLGGPSSLHVVDKVSSFSFMGEIGIALLLFTVGLDLPLEKVRKFGRTALVAGTAQVVFTSALVMGIAMSLGLGPSASFIVGIAVSMSSTAVVISVLNDRAEADSVHGLITTGVLIAQDVIVVLVLLAIPLLPGATDVDLTGSFIVDFSIALAKLVGLVFGIILVERIVMRRIFNTQQQSGTRELLALSSLTVSLGAIGVCWALDLSPALGGFIAGIVMADAAYAAQVRSEIAPIRMGLIAIFFAYVGMLSDAGWMLENAGLIVLVVVPLILGKAIITFVAARVARVPSAPALMTGAGLGQLGEFSFAVLTAGIAVELVSAETFRLLVSVSFVTLLVTPALISVTSRYIERSRLADGAEIDIEGDAGTTKTGHALVIGAGPAGRSVVQAVAAAQFPVTVIELNPRVSTNVGDCPSAMRIVFGDAARPEILLRADVRSASIIVVTIPDPVAIRTIVAQASQLAPDVPVVARGRYNRFINEIIDAGADAVVDEETLTGRELAGVALRRLAAAGAIEPTRAERRRADDESNVSEARVLPGDSTVDGPESVLD
ncbi:MAG: cation:proton antiporter [Gaiellales bacterium]